MRLRRTTLHGVRVIEPLDRVTVGLDNARRFESEVLGEIGDYVAELLAAMQQ